MSRRASLPGADELFRRTSGATEVESEPLPDAVSSPESTSSNAAVLVSLAVVDDSEQVPAGIDGADAGLVRRAPVRRRTKSGADRKSTGRERHEEKITVYVSPEELVDLEQASGRRHHCVDSQEAVRVLRRIQVAAAGHTHRRRVSPQVRGTRRAIKR